jgi:hypothetical protein
MLNVKRLHGVIFQYFLVTIAETGPGLAPPLHILEVLFSNFEPETGCPNWGFPKFPPYLQVKFLERTLKKQLPISLLFTNHSIT